MGRSPEIEEEICARISNGEPLRAICRDEHLPSWQAVYQWIAADEAFARRIAHARELGFDAIAEDALAIADDGTNDWMERHGKEGESLGYELNGEHVQRSKLRIETRLKLLSKWSPKKYGDKQDINLSGNLDVAATIIAARKRSGG